MLSQTSKTLWLNYPDKYTKIGFIGRLHLWWPLLLCIAIANEFHPTTHKVNLQASKAIILPKSKVSSYSHHLGLFALPETRWPFRVSGCDPYLIYTLHTTMRSPHETHGITPITYTFPVSHTTTTTFISYIQFLFHPIIMCNSFHHSYQTYQSRS